MSTDRELLEFAAKGARLKGSWNREVACIRLLPGKKTPYGMVYSYWDPLSDGDAALRLAANLGLSISTFGQVDVTSPDDLICCIELPEEHAGDVHAATRRAIVRAAAEIGKSAGSGALGDGGSGT